MNPTKTEKCFESLFRTGGPYEDLSYLSDSKLRTEDGYIFDVHRIILAKANHYFRALFRGLGKQKRDFLVPGIEGRILEMILLNIYNETIPFNQSDIFELIIASDYLLADSTLLEIKEYAKHNISLNNCIPIYMAAFKINYKDHHKDILRESYRYIQTHFEALVSQEFIKDIPFECMKKILEDNNLCLGGEHIIWLATVKWTQGNISHRLCHVPDLLLCLKSGDVDESLATEILCHDIVANNSFCKDLNEIKSKADQKNNLSVLLEYGMKCSVRPPAHRRPGWVHLIASYGLHYMFVGQKFHCPDRVEMFITFDENLDVWRKLGEFSQIYSQFDPDYITCIGHSVYMSNGFGKFIAFDILEKRWREMHFQRPRGRYHLVNLKNAIYVIGAFSNVTHEDGVIDVDFYCPESDTWFTAMSMLPIKSYSAVAFQESIYAVGKSPDNLTMMAQVYDADSDSWAMFPPPSIFRDGFALVAYYGKLYIIGDTYGSTLRKKVERFDFDRYAWETIEDLPYAYEKPKAIVLNDRLVVFEWFRSPTSRRLNPPVLWNETKTSWELLDKFFDLNSATSYLFCTVYDSENIAGFSHDPGIQFEKSHFNETEIFSKLQ